MKDKLFVGIQVISGLMLVMFGLNGFLQFMPMGEMNPAMGAYMGALFITGFIFPIVSFIQIIVGISFITNKFTPLMAIIITPVMINAFIAHLFLDPAGIGGSLFIIISIVLVMIRYKGRYKEIFKA